MPVARWWSRAVPLPGSPTAAALEVDATSWLAVAGDVAAAGGHLLALWVTLGGAGGASANVRAGFLIDGRLLVAQLPVTDLQPRYRGLQALFPCAARMQRAAFDLTGVPSDDGDERSWLRHAAWPTEFHPLRDRATGGSDLDVSEVTVDTYPFVRVEGDGVHEIPVGPVHAGVIEPGHFRFSVVGEKVLKLEQRLRYVHKGIERRFTELSLRDGCRLAARVSGDSAVAFSWAYCQALEGMAPVDVPTRALHLRALCLELERLQNHLGDLGALGNDAGFAFGLTQFSRLKEQLLRVTQDVLGRRYLMDAVVPGGVQRDLTRTGLVFLRNSLREIVGEAQLLRTIYEEHEGVRDRFTGA